ncbi:Unknown protein [Striga hermonthica]|uniref:Transposase n=1 Tax=Striga hermonthica TaxID=68872 RepID=A0A9N7N7H2_STRHE|nr:Unknown protein [Striga hermonthica]
MIDESTTLNEPKLKGMYNYVHIDEKWFHMKKNEQTYYLLDNEEDPHRSCQSKNNIEKVMFLAATTRPRFDGEGRVVFSGKVGYWAFVTEQPAPRNSRNMRAGTMEMKVVTSVKRKNVKAFFIEKSKRGSIGATGDCWHGPGHGWMLRRDMRTIGRGLGTSGARGWAAGSAPGR